jgi:hypothetical protein
MKSIGSLVVGFLGVCALMASCGGGGGGTGDGGGAGGSGCPTGFETCACYGNHTCEAGLTCASNICVNLSAGGGAGGNNGGGGAGGVAAGAGGAIAGGAGGANAGFGGSSAGAGGSGTGMGGTGMGGAGVGGAPGCSCPSGQECTTDNHCIDPKIIDDLADCNTSIYAIRGRNGGWYGAADVGINMAFAVSTPPSGFADRRCAAWTTGGPTGNGTTRYALMGVVLTTTGTPVDLRGYTGISVSLEAQSVDFTLKTINGGYFTHRLPTTAGTQTFAINFSTLVARSDSAVTTLNLADVTDIQFTVITPSAGYGFVVHALTLY